MLHYDPILWFGYVYKPSGDYQVKRYFSPLDISEVQECVGDTVEWCTSTPFPATNREHALNVLANLYNKEF